MKTRVYKPGEHELGLLVTGKLWKKSHKGNFYQPRAVELYQPEGTHPELRYQGKNRDRVPVHRVVEVDARKYTFTVVNDQEANTFRAASLVEQRMWLDHLPVNTSL